MASAAPRVFWWRPGARQGTRVRVTGRTARGYIRVRLLLDDGSESPIVRMAPAGELQCPHDGGADTLNRLFADAPLINKPGTADPGPPVLGGTRPDTESGDLLEGLA